MGYDAKRFDEFISTWLGRKADYDGQYNGQCVDIYRFYVRDVLKFPQSPGVGGATEIWDSADPAYYDFIKYRPGLMPVRGDIPIWNRNAGGGAGHVDMVDEPLPLENMFWGIDQNWPTLDKVTRTKHTFTNVIGWLHPKGGTMSAETELDQTRKDRDRNWNIGLAMCNVLGISMDVSADVMMKRVSDSLNAKLEVERNRANSDKERLIKESYDKGVTDGKAQQPVPTVPVAGEQLPESFNLTGFEQNGLIIETTVGNKKSIQNFTKK